MEKVRKKLIEKDLKNTILRKHQILGRPYPETKNVLKNASLYDVVVNAKLTKNYLTDFC